MSVKDSLRKIELIKSSIKNKAVSDMLLTRIEKRLSEKKESKHDSPLKMGF
jgi:hypothetical protein